MHPMEPAERSSYRLTLFVNGRGPYSVQAVRALRTLSEQDLAGYCEVRIVDVLTDPELARDARVVVTPTLIASMPLRETRCIGKSILDREALRAALDLHSPIAASSSCEQEPDESSNDAGGDHRTCELTVYVSGSGTYSDQVLRTVQDIADCDLFGGYTLAIVDVLKDPGLARKANVVTTPTLIARMPQGERRCSGRQLLSVEQIREAIIHTDSAPVADSFPQRVVIVEHGLDLANQLEHWLHAGSMPFASVESVDRATEFLSRVSKNIRCVVVVVDLDVTGIDGLRRIASFVELRPAVFHIIALTSTPSVMDELVALQLGVNDFAEKPIEGRDLYRQIKRCLLPVQVRAQVESNLDGTGVGA